MHNSLEAGEQSLRLILQQDYSAISQTMARWQELCGEFVSDLDRAQAKSSVFTEIEHSTFLERLIELKESEAQVLAPLLQIKSTERNIELAKLLILHQQAHFAFRLTIIDGLTDYAARCGREHAIFHQALLGKACRESISRLKELSDHSEDSEIYFFDVWNECLLLPGQIRSANEELRFLLSVIHEESKEACPLPRKTFKRDWRLVGVSEENTPHWEAYNILPEEAKEWLQNGFSDPEEVGAWKWRGFNFREAYDWDSAGYEARQAAQLRRMGYPTPEELYAAQPAVDRLN